MSIEVLDQPIHRHTGETARDIHIVQFFEDRKFVDGDEITNAPAFAQVTEWHGRRTCTYGPMNQEIAIVKGVVEAYEEYEKAAHYEKTVRSRALDGLLPLPFFDKRVELAKRNALKTIMGSAVVKIALQDSKKEKPPAIRRLAIG